MVPTLFACYAVAEMAARWEHPLPSPFPPCIRIFTFERIRQRNAAPPAFEVRFMLRFDQSEVLKKRLSHCARQRSVTIFVPLAGANHDFILREIDIFDTQATAL